MFHSNSTATLDSISSQVSHAMSGGTIDDALDDLAVVHVPQTSIGGKTSPQSPLQDSKENSFSALPGLQETLVGGEPCSNNNNNNSNRMNFSDRSLSSSSSVIEVDDTASDPDSFNREEKEANYADNILSKYEDHLFILTHAGKPIYSKHGDVSQMNDVCGLFQLLYNMRGTNAAPTTKNNSLDKDSTGPQNPQKRDTSADTFDRLYQIDFADIALYFYSKDEIMYVKGVRQCPERHHDTNYYNIVKRQMLHLHYFFFTVLPSLDSVLRHNPGYDVQGYLNSADWDMLKEWNQQLETSLSFVLHATPIAPLSLSLRNWVYQWMGTIRRQCTQHTSDYLYTFLVFNAKVVGVFSPPPGRYSPQKEDYTHCGLGTTDMRLLLNFVQCSMQRQQCGHLWAPVCLPFFNKSGYLWCHVSNYSTLVRESLIDKESGASARTETPLHLQREKGVLLVHLTAGDNTVRNIQTAVEEGALMVAESPENRKKFYLLEQELLANSVDHSATSDSSWLQRLFGLNQPPFLWFSATCGGETVSPKNSDTVAGYLASAEHPFYFADNDIRESLYRQLLVHIHSLQALPSAPSSLPMLIVEEPNFSVVLLRPTTALLKLLCEQFYTPKEMGLPKRPPSKTIPPTSSSGRNGIPSHPPRKAYVLHKFLKTCASSFGQVICIFPPHSTEELMLSWVTYLLLQLTFQVEDLTLKEQHS